MAGHRFICDRDGTVVTDTTCMGDHPCPKCSEEMRWDIRNGGFAIGGGGDYHHTSDTLAIHPSDIPEHRKLFPGVDVTPEGQPMFTSARQQEKYAEKSAGCYKKAQKTKSQLGRTKL